MKTQEVRETEINIKNRSQAPEHIARMVWQPLFDLYREGNGNLNHMYDLLCDLLHIGKLANRAREFKFYWGFHAESGQTNLTQDVFTIRGYHDSYYLVEVDTKRIRITKKI